MYTVARFVGNSASDETLVEIGQALNDIRNGLFERLDRRGHRFSVSISTADSWHAHLVDIRAFVHAMAPVISEAQSLGISVEIDVAVEPEDKHENNPYTSVTVPHAVLTELGGHGITLVVTSYSSA